MTLESKPKLRPMQPVPIDQDGQRLICLRDPSGLVEKIVALSPHAFFLAAHCNGRNTLRDIQAAYMRRFGELVPTENIGEVVRRLDEALLLDNDRFHAFHRSLIDKYARAKARPALHAGTAYPSEPSELRETLDAFFTADEGPGPIDPARRGSDVVAVAAPHIDLRRGGATFAHAYKALAEGSAAETFVILGILHQAAEGMFVFTDKDYETPLGTVACDREFVADLLRRTGSHIGDDQLIHRTEHSIEFQAVFLQHLIGTSRPLRIVPILCGPILEPVGDNPDPLQLEPLGTFVGAFKELLHKRGETAAGMCVEVLSCARGRVGRGRPTYSLRCPETGAGNRPVENESGNGWNMKIATLRSQ